MKFAFWNDRSLQFQLTVTMATLIAIALTGITSLYVNREQGNVRRELQRQAEVILTTLTSTQADALYLFDIDGITTVLKTLSESDMGVQARVYDDGGRLLADSTREQNLVFSVKIDPFAMEMMESGELTTRWTDEYLEVGREIVVVRESIGAISVQISTDKLNIQEQIALQQGLYLALAGVGLGIVASMLISRAITGPLEYIAYVAALIGEGKLSTRVDIKGQNEIGQLANTFNGMLTTIQQRDSERTELIKDLESARHLAEENSRLKSDFLSMMSHELRTPMNAIQGFTSIMLQRMAGVDYNDKAERYLKKVESNSDRLLGLINDFLDLSRIESGRLELASSPVSPMDMAQQWQDSLSVLAEHKGLEFAFNIDPNLPETIYADEESITKIAINLVGNAIKFTEEGSVTVSLQKQNNQMELTVSDTGIGIPPHALEFVFDEFRQVDQSSKRIQGGTGLGLAITQKLARAMNGTVTLQSKVGVGSTFSVLLPIHIEEQMAYGVG